MNNSKVRIPKEIAPDVFALAAQLYAQENQDYFLEEIMQAGAEVQIPPEVIQQAIQQIQAKQIRDRDRQRSLKLILTSGGIGAAIALFGFWTYNTVASNATPSGRSLEANLRQLMGNLYLCNQKPSPARNTIDKNLCNR
ncbi:hypothetical protein [Nostoc sp.]|uniref:hypothetical protein n=1 Tax=Nostoc sp. TaxID=1180 RepID=UPI002FFA89DE